MDGGREREREGGREGRRERGREGWMDGKCDLSKDHNPYTQLGLMSGTIRLFLNVFGN